MFSAFIVIIIIIIIIIKEADVRKLDFRQPDKRLDGRPVR